MKPRFEKEFEMFGGNLDCDWTGLNSSSVHVSVVFALSFVHVCTVH